MATSSQTAKEEPTMSTMIIRGGTETAEQTEVLFDQITRWVEAMGREVDDLYALAKALVKNGDGWNISTGLPVADYKEDADLLADIESWTHES
jgi:hypothetical protein